MLNRNAEIRVLGGVEKSSFYFFARQKGPSWADVLKTVTHSGAGSEEYHSVQGAGHDQLVDHSWIGWHLGEVSSIINFLVSASLGSTFLWSAVFIWSGSASCRKQLRNVCQAFIYIFQGTGISAFLLCGRIIV